MSTCGLRWLVGGLIMGTACGAAPSGPLNRAALRASHPRSIVALESATPRFEGTTSSSEVMLPLLVFGIAGGIAAVALSESDAKSRDLRGTKKVYDPAVPISDELIRRLSTRFSLEVRHPRKAHLVRPGAVVEVDDLAKQNEDVDLVLNVRTTAWGFTPVRFAYYGVNYDGAVSLIDTRIKAVIAEGRCLSVPVDTPEAPSYEELVANDAGLLKTMFHSLEDFCTEEYRTRVLGLYGK
jgi:hypothetical protein